jgi:hypothetical protein
MRFQVHHRATPLEPELPPETEVAELGQLLDGFAPETSPVEQMVTSSVTTAGITTDLVPVGPEETSKTFYEHYVAALGGGYSSTWLALGSTISSLWQSPLSGS